MSTQLKKKEASTWIVDCVELSGEFLRRIVLVDSVGFICMQQLSLSSQIPYTVRKSTAGDIPRKSVNYHTEI